MTDTTRLTAEERETLDRWDVFEGRSIFAAVEAILTARQADAWDEGWAARAEYEHRRDVPLTWPDLNPHRAALAASDPPPFRMTDDDAIRKHMADRGGRMTSDRASDPQEEP